MIPERLYKYLPSKWLRAVVGDGQLLFRNLTYFRQCEDRQRGDPLEAHHRDNPSNGAQLTVVSSGKIIRGSFSFLNSVDSDLIYAFCLSKTCSRRLLAEFDSNACIEIMDVEEFVRRVQRAVIRLPSTHNWGLLHGDARYYADNEAATFNVKNPRDVIFAKSACFTYQDEYRLAFGTRKAFRLKQTIIDNRIYDFAAEAMKGTAKQKTIQIGDISDITNIIHT
jgi:hypothetical protein